jgi:hypothetical protein
MDARKLDAALRLQARDDHARHANDERISDLRQDCEQPRQATSLQ